MSNYRHGGIVNGQMTRLYRIWRGVLNRANGIDKAKHYAERGITMCDEWRDFARFKEWAFANGYSDTLTIERVDNDGPYSPANCVWATWKVQARNRRNSRLVTAFGETMVLAAWAERSGISFATIKDRLNKGWAPEAAVSTLPARRGKSYGTAGCSSA